MEIIWQYHVSRPVLLRPLRNEYFFIRFVQRSIAYVYACVMHNTKRAAKHHMTYRHESHKEHLVYHAIHATGSAAN